MLFSEIIGLTKIGHKREKMYGELVPLGGGDPVPLLKKSLLVGRRESCDIVLRFSNVSAHHCQLTVVGGYWYVKDLQSRNGVKVNGTRVQDKRLDSGDVLSVAKHSYEIKYSPVDNGAVGPPPPDTSESDIFGTSLLERAGLTRAQVPKVKVVEAPKEKRYDITKDEPGQLKQDKDPI
jgi:predicted component of type VI protein secretion system